MEALLGQEFVTSDEVPNFYEVVKFCNEKLKKDPGNLEYIIARAEAKSSLGDYIGALIDFTTALKIDSTSKELYYNAGILFSRVEKYDSALNYLSKAISIDTFYYEAYYGRGLVNYYLGNYTYSIQDYSILIRAGYNNKSNLLNQAIYGRSLSYIELGNYSLAQSDLLNLIKSDDISSKYYATLGYAKFKTGQNQEAIVNLNEALKIDHENSLAYKYLSEVYFNLKQFSESCYFFKLYAKYCKDKTSINVYYKCF